MFLKPKNYKREQGIQTFINQVEITDSFKKIVLTDITPEYISKLDNKELLSLHYIVHLMYRNALKENPKSVEDFVNAHILVLNEIKKRKLNHYPMKDNLDKLSEELEGKKSREKALDNALELNDIDLVDDYISIIGSTVEGNKVPNDTDILIKTGRRDENLEKILEKIFQAKLGEKLHWSYIPMGSHGNHIPLYKLMLKKVEQVEVKHGVLEDVIPEKFIQLKTINNTYLSVEEFYNLIVKDTKIIKRYWIEPELMGRRLTVCRKNGIISMFDENCNNYKNDKLSDKISNIENPIDFIFDGILLANGNFIITDYISKNSSQLYDDPLLNRKFFMTKIGLSKGIYLINSYYITTQEDLVSAINEFIELGLKKLVAKLSASKYSLDGKTDEWYKIDLFKNVEKSVKPFDKIKPLKPGKAYHSLEFYETGDAWLTWGQGFISENIPIACEIKFDGFRTIAESDGKNTFIYFEDAKSDRSKILPNFAKEILDLGDIILDGELIQTKNGKQIPRRDMIGIAEAKEPIDDSGIKLHVFDILYSNGEDLTKKTWSERQKILVNRVKNSNYIEVVKPIIAKNKEEFYTAIKKQSSIPYSEGSMCKAVNSIYELDGSTNSWAKVKNMVEIHYIVLKEIEIKGPAHQYEVGVLLGNKNENDYNNVLEFYGKKCVLVGKTYNTDLKVKPGDVISVAVAEIVKKEENGKITYSHDNPIVRNLEPGVPDNIDFIDKISEYGRSAKPGRKKTLDQLFLELATLLGKKNELREGQITFKEGMKDDDTFQIHERGLSEDQVKYTKPFGLNRLNQLKKK